MKKTDVQQAEQITRENIESVLRLEKEVKNSRSVMMRVVDSITAFCGSFAFVWIHIVWFAVWISFDQMFSAKIDPYPFQLLTLVVSLEAILLSTFILISQNRDSQLAERRNHLILQLALLSEQENTKMLKMLESQQKHFGLVDIGDPSIQALEVATSPANLVKQIDSALNGE